MKGCFNPLNTKLNPICHLLTLLEAHHILHISRIRVKSSSKGEKNGTCRISKSQYMASDKRLYKQT